MLVLSRKQNQTVCFPSLGISVHVCQVVGNKVRLGFDAPNDIEIVRQELCDDPIDQKSLREKRHLRQNQLNAATVAMSLAQRQLEVGRVEEAQETLNAAFESLATLDEAVSKSSPVPPLTDETQPVASRQKAKRALVVEDNDNERELLASYLRLSGFEVDTAANGLEAIKQLQNSDELPQAVILDMHMPKLDGAKTVSNIRHREDMKDLPVFAVSGTSPREMNVPIGPSGVNRWFEKPVNPSQLVDQLNAEVDELAPGYVWPLGVSFASESVTSPA